MSTSPSPDPLHSISKSEYYSSLPWFRRLLAMLNWRPVVDYELREIEFNRREIAYKQRETEFERRRIAYEQRMKQLNEEENAFNERMQSLDAKLAALWPSSSSSTMPPQPPDNDSVTSSP